MLGRVMAFDRVFRLTFMPFVLLAIILIFSAACKGGAPGADVTESLLAEAGNHPSQDAGGVAGEIAGLDAPPDVDPGLFDALKKAFAAKLAAKLMASGRLTASAPTGDAGRVTDLAYDPASGDLSWSYVNAGDCDLSGEVGISDITPIAQNYLAITDDGIGDDEYEAWIDGDDSGEVGISDITPIAENYLNDVMEYRIVTSDSLDDGFTPIGDAIPYGDQGSFPKTYSVTLPEGADAYVAVEPVGADLTPGERSNVVSVEGEPTIASVEPTSGLEFTSVTFSASVSGAEPLTYDWDFGGGAYPNTSPAPSPTVTLRYVGGYPDARLTVTNDYGEDTFEFTLTVSGEAPDITDVQPQSGVVNSEVTFD
ncbi:PKD domain-containing protein, partial [bacterium]|nr:PKD domain-containing protein [bacterium]